MAAIMWEGKHPVNAGTGPIDLGVTAMAHILRLNAVGGMKGGTGATTVGGGHPQLYHGPAHGSATGP